MADEVVRDDTAEDLITLSLARWRVMHREVTVEDYRAIVAAAHEVARQETR